MNAILAGRGGRPFASPLARRLVLAIIVVSSVITVLLTGLQLYAEYRDETGQIEADFLQIEQSHLKSLSSSLWQTNAHDIRLQLEGIVRMPNLEYVALREADKTWGEAGRQVSRHMVERNFPVTFDYQGKSLDIGTLTAVAGLDAVYRKLSVRALTILASNAFKTFLVAAFAFFLFHALLNRHLVAISDYFRDLYFKGFTSMLKLDRRARQAPDELDQVCASINLLQEKAHSTQLALKESEAGLRRAQSVARLAHVITGPAGRFESWSETLPELAGVEPARVPVSMRAWLKLVHPEDRGALRAKSIEGARSGERIEHDYRLLRADGASVHIHQVAEPLETVPGMRARWFSTLQDVTEEKRVVEALARQQAQLRAMARRMADLQEKERRDIARELHDRMGQTLTALAFELEAIGTGDKSPASLPHIARSRELIQQSGEALGGLLSDLRPPMLATYGLMEAVQWQADEFSQRTGIATQVSREDAGARLSTDYELALFRIGQAALDNIAKHARAQRVTIALRREGSKVRFEIGDDGVGFDVPRALASGRWGLAIMRERAEAIDGELRVESQPGGGTSLSVEFEAVA